MYYFLKRKAHNYNYLLMLIYSIDNIDNKYPNQVQYFPITGILLKARTKSHDKINIKIHITIIVRQISMPEWGKLTKNGAM